MKKQDWHTNRIDGDDSNKKQDYRTPYEKDKCRIIHSYPFRRLQGKIQIVSGKESDFHRNRLTHSIEVASIAQNIYRKVRRENEELSRGSLKEFLKSQDKDVEELLFTIGLIHDIGHPPFGHGGENALNFKMHKAGGFEGN